MNRPIVIGCIHFLKKKRQLMSVKQPQGTDLHSWVQKRDTHAQITVYKQILSAQNHALQCTHTNTYIPKIKILLFSSISIVDVLLKGIQWTMSMSWPLATLYSKRTRKLENFCFHEDAHTCWWSVYQVYLITPRKLNESWVSFRTCLFKMFNCVSFSLCCVNITFITVLLFI